MAKDRQVTDRERRLEVLANFGNMGAGARTSDDPVASTKLM
jgi:hypothetical protein